MHPVDVSRILDSMVILVDTREQPTDRFEKRMKMAEFPYIRQKLNFGDYSCKCTDDGTEYSLDNRVCIERKMNIDELCHCFCQDRERFVKEFNRAREQNAKIYLLIEDANFEKIYNGKYRSKVHPNSLIASIFAFLARYDCQIIMCRPETTGRIIRDILYREMKEYLEVLENES